MSFATTAAKGYTWPEHPLALTEDDVVRINYEHFASLFPKVCSICGRRFATVGDYVRATIPVGNTIAYDADAGDWKAPEPMGIFALANCTCGNTLSLSSNGMPLETFHAVLEWLRVESDLRRVTPVALMEHVRNQIRKLALADAGHGDT